MKTLMLRQVRMLATPALVSVVLGVLTLAGLSLTDGWRILTSSPADIALALVGVVAPWLIAVAAIAPDAESGGLAFLGGLPLGRARHFAARTLVAAGWSVVAILPFGILAAPRVLEWVHVDTLLTTIPLGVMSFIAGLTAGAVARQSLAAFVAAPLLVAAPLGLYDVFAVTIGAPAQFHLAAPFVLAAVLVLAGWLAFREPAGRSFSWRPLVRTTGLLLGAVALGCGVTTAAWAGAIAFPGRTAEWATSHGVVLRYDREVPDWPVGHGDWNTTLYPLSDVQRVRRLDDLGEGWTFDEHLRVLEAAPDGRLLVTASLSRDILLLDLPRKVVLARSRGSELPWSQETGGLGPTATRSNPWFLSPDRTLRTLDGKVLYRLPESTRLDASGGDRIVTTTGDEAERVDRVLVDLATGVETPLELTSENAYVVLSPNGRYLAVRADGAITFRDLERSAEVVIHSLPAPSTGSVLRGVTFSPNDRTAIVEWSADERHAFMPRDPYRPSVIDGTTFALDLSAGTSVAIPAGLWIADWSPSGRRVLTYDGWIDLDESALIRRSLPAPDGVVRRFVDDDTVIWSNVLGELTTIELDR